MSIKILSADSPQQTQEVSYWGAFTSSLQNLIKGVCSAIASPFLSLHNALRPINPITGEREIQFISASTEIALGKRIYSAACALEGGILDDEKMQKRAKDILAKIVQHAQRPDREFEYEIQILNCDEVNAWAAPGGKLAFYKGLIAKIDEMDLSEWEGLTSDDVLAAVIGHEAAHAAIGHTRRRLQESYIIQIALLAAGVAHRIYTNRETDKEDPVNTEHGPKKTGWDKSQEEEERRKRQRAKSEESSYSLYTVLSYFAYQVYMFMGSREAEYEADLFGTHFSFAAGYDVRGSLAIQKLFIKVHGGDGENTSGLEWISSHPDPQNRLRANAETVNAIFKEHGCYKKVDV